MTKTREVRVGVIADIKSLPDGQILYKVRIPTLHGRSVKDSDLPYIPAAYAPGLGPSKTSFGAFDKGQWVVITQHVGEYDSGYGTITGIYQNPVQTPELQGNSSLANLWRPYLQEARDAVQKVKEITKTVENEVEVYKVTTQTDHKLIDSLGFSSNEGQSLTLTVNIPALNDISTAINQFEAVFNSAESMLGNLQGSLFSLGNLGNLLNLNGLFDKLTANMPSIVKDALTSILNNSVTVSGDPRSQQVNMEVFLPNLVNGLQNVKTIGEMTSTLDQLINDSSQFGLQGIEKKIEGLFGQIIQKIDQFGNIISEISSEIESAISSFEGLVSSVSAVDSNLWSTEQKMSNMIQSLKTETAQAIQEMISGLPK